MSTLRQIEANRNNARSSTGPRTRCGKARACGNARRHGLSVSVVSDARLSEQVEGLACLIVGQIANAGVLKMARRFAEAQIDLDRIRRARYHACLLALDEGTGSEQAAVQVELLVREQVLQLKSLDRYERRALSRRRSAARAFDTAFLEAVSLQDLPE
jgi:hypothetical protein